MLLYLENGDPFATGLIDYLYRPATDWEDTSRILIPVEIEGLTITAMVDTGAPYVICTPEVGVLLALDSEDALREETLRWHGEFSGYLHRLNIMFKAAQGENMLVEATVFIPDSDSAEAWSYGRRPIVIGMGGCLERMRFAIDPASDILYFGPLS